MTSPEKQALGRALLQELKQLPGDADLDYCLRTIEAGATLNNVTAEQETALHLAAFYGYEEVTAALIARGAPLDAQNSNGHTPLMLAASLGHLNVLEQLLDAGAGLYLKNLHSETVFDRAQNAELVRAFALEGQNGVDHVFDHTGAGDLAVFGDVADQDDGRAGTLGKPPRR